MKKTTNKRLTGNELRALREKLGETQVQFAKRLFYSHRVQIARLEARGDKVIPRGADARIRALGLFPLIL